MTVLEPELAGCHLGTEDTDEVPSVGGDLSLPHRALSATFGMRPRLPATTRNTAKYPPSGEGEEKRRRRGAMQIP